MEVAVHPKHGVLRVCTDGPGRAATGSPTRGCWQPVRARVDADGKSDAKRWGGRQWRAVCFRKHKRSYDHPSFGVIQMTGEFRSAFENSGENRDNASPSETATPIGCAWQSQYRLDRGKPKTIMVPPSGSRGNEKGRNHGAMGVTLHFRRMENHPVLRGSRRPKPIDCYAPFFGGEKTRSQQRLALSKRRSVKCH